MQHLVVRGCRIPSTQNLSEASQGHISSFQQRLFGAVQTAAIDGTAPLSLKGQTLHAWFLSWPTSMPPRLIAASGQHQTGTPQPSGMASWPLHEGLEVELLSRHAAGAAAPGKSLPSSGAVYPSVERGGRQGPGTGPPC